MIQFLQGLDAFTKARDDCRVKTNAGAIGEFSLHRSLEFVRSLQIFILPLYFASHHSFDSVHGNYGNALCF